MFVVVVVFVLSACVSAKQSRISFRSIRIASINNISITNFVAISLKACARECFIYFFGLVVGLFGVDGAIRFTRVCVCYLSEQ